VLQKVNLSILDYAMWTSIKTILFVLVDDVFINFDPCIVFYFFVESVMRFDLLFEFTVLFLQRKSVFARADNQFKESALVFCGSQGVHCGGYIFESFR